MNLRWLDKTFLERSATEAKGARPKYKNKKTQVDGRTFDSRLEAGRYVELRRMQEAGLIEDLVCQVPFKLEVNGQLICKYIADFGYTQDGRRVIEDAKGVRTREYQIKRKLMAACLGINIVEFRRKNARKP